MKIRRGGSRAAWYEAIGFGAIIVISWLDELLELPRRVFGGTGQAVWKEGTLETVVVLAVAVPTLLLTRRLASRLYSLEGFVRMCAWCRKVEAEGRWMPMEEFFAHHLDTRTSHGMCPECEATARGSLGERPAPPT